MKRYMQKKQQSVCAVQWTGEMTPGMTELVRQHELLVIADKKVVGKGGWTAQPGDWFVSASGEDLSVCPDEVFRRNFEEAKPVPTESEHEVEGKEFVRDLDTLLVTGLRLSREDYPGVFHDRDRLLRRLAELLADHGYVAALRERKRLLEKIGKELT